MQYLEGLMPLYHGRKDHFGQMEFSEVGAGVGDLGDHLARRRVQDIADVPAVAGTHVSPISSLSCSLVAVMLAPHLPAVAICPRYAGKSA